MGRCSLVGIATDYGLDGTGIEYRCEARFSPPVETGPGAHPSCYTICTGSLQGVKPPRRGVDHPSPCIPEVKEGIELYLPPPGTSWPVVG